MRLNIAIFQPELIYPRGAERQVCELAHQLSMLGHDITIYTFNKNVDFEFDYLIKDVDIVNLNKSYFPIFKKTYSLLPRLIHFSKIQLQNLLYTIQISKLLKKHDFINAHNYPASWISYFTDIPVIWTCNEPPYWYSYKLSFILRLFFMPIMTLDLLLTKNVYLVLTLNRMIGSLVSRAYTAKVNVIGSGASLLRKVNHIDNLVFDVLFVGELHEKKRPEDMLNAIRKIKTNLNNYKLHIVGTGSMSGRLKKMSKQLNVNAIFYDQVSDNKLYELYDIADIALFVPEKEPWGIFPLEAILAGIPTVVSDQCGLLEAIKNYPIKPIDVGDIKALSGRILDVYENADQYNELFARLGRKIGKKLHWKNYAKKFMQITETIY